LRSATALVNCPERAKYDLSSLERISQASEIELIENCRSRLAHYKCPRSVEFLESLPRTGTGKVLKRDLRKKYWQGRETIRPEFAENERNVKTLEPKSTSGLAVKQATPND